MELFKKDGEKSVLNIPKMMINKNIKMQTSDGEQTV